VLSLFVHLHHIRGVGGSDLYISICIILMMALVLRRLAVRAGYYMLIVDDN
jgi:hypothetical protein